ncbi:MAG TPA: hypothetical protein VE089_04645 [Nitrososphaeraceae archaeon]|nr:hypothetical protein [Nitrososphaeraceae archaeon]
MIENMVYLIMGFSGTYLGLEAAWHFTGCNIRDKSVQPCLFKQIRILAKESNKPLFR